MTKLVREVGREDLCKTIERAVTNMVETYNETLHYMANIEKTPPTSLEDLEDRIDKESHLTKDDAAKYLNNLLNAIEAKPLADILKEVEELEVNDKKILSPNVKKQLDMLVKGIEHGVVTNYFDMVKK